MAKAKWPWAAVQAYRRHKDWIHDLTEEREHWRRLCIQQHKARWGVRIRWALVGAAVAWAVLRCAGV